MSNAHSAELPYLFDFTLGDRPLTATEKRLSTQMMRYWAAFARSGNPNVARAGRPGRSTPPPRAPHTRPAPVGNTW